MVIGLLGNPCLQNKKIKVDKMKVNQTQVSSFCLFRFFLKFLDHSVLAKAFLHVVVLLVQFSLFFIHSGGNCHSFLLVFIIYYLCN